MQKERLALWFSVDGEVRYLSHRDMLRLWQRALVRGRLPLRYSEGFNPHVRLSLPLPRNVGAAADRELLLAELTERGDVGAIIKRLAGELPEGMAIKEGWYVPPKASAQPVRARYNIVLDESVEKDFLRQRIRAFLEAREWPVVRERRGRHPRRQFNLRGGVEELVLTGNLLECTIGIGAEGSARIDELLAALEVSSAREVVEIRRTRVEYPDELWDVN